AQPLANHCDVSSPEISQHTNQCNESEAWARNVEEIAQRFDENGGGDRAGDRNVKKKFTATCEQAMQPRIVAAEMKSRDVMGDGLRGDLQRQSQNGDERDGNQNEAVFAAIAAQVRADNELKHPVNQKRQKTDGCKNDAAFQKPARRAGIVFQLMTHAPMVMVSRRAISSPLSNSRAAPGCRRPVFAGHQAGSEGRRV